MPRHLRTGEEIPRRRLLGMTISRSGAMRQMYSANYLNYQA